MNQFFGLVVLCCLAGSLSGCGPAPTPPAVIAPPPCIGPALTTGEISDDPDDVIKSKTPFVAYIAGNLADFGYQCGNLEVVDTLDEMTGLIEQGKVDVYMDSMYPATLVSSATGAQPILRRWRNCDPDYYSVIFTTSASGITTIDELSGHMMAMDQIYSTSGFVLPAVYLIDQGEYLAIKDAYDMPVPADEIGIYFSFDDKNTLNLVLEGKVIAGATDDYNFSKWEKESPGTFRKLAETEPVPRQVVLVRSGLEAGTREAIRKQLAGAHLDPAGLEVMNQDAGTCLYDDTPEGIQATFEEMRQMHDKLMTIPGWKETYLQGH
jgi:phosphonate transport system substrate-binding protein